MRTFVVLLFVASFAGCTPKPGQGPGLGSPGVISCSTQAVAAAAPDGIGPVNRCLSGDGDVSACLLGLIQPATQFTLALVGCLTRHEGSAASSASQANPGDKIDAYRAARAHDFLDKMAARGYVFAD